MTGAAARAFLAGLPGVLALAWLAPAPAEVPRALLLVQPLVLLGAMAAAGAWAAPRCGFLLHRGGAPLRRAAAAGLLGGVALALADHAGRAAWQAAPGVPPSLVEAWSPEALALGLLYGGLTEEVLLRWGVMSLLVLGAWRLLARHAPRPPGWAVGAGAAGAAVLFALGHLPALAATGAALEAGTLARTLGLNTLAGLLFGALFARAGLTAAMAAHAAAHLGFAAVAQLA
ncbi:MAG: CPBP family glutamic-type intramembrane protease [Rubritepida sp.]|nr:CPBP family glutamic-type intramembrane protease [Rubritepida sp.]